MVQHSSGSAPFKLLLLQDAFKVLHPLFQVPHVSGQVTVEKAHWVAKHCHPGTDAAFVPLRMREKKRGLKRGPLLLYSKKPCEWPKTIEKALYKGRASSMNNEIILKMNALSLHVSNVCVFRDKVRILFSDRDTDP